MKGLLSKLPKPFFVLAPMDDVTDTAFRRIVHSCAPADLYMTEFANADGLQSPGRKAVMKKLKFYEQEHPLIAQIWGAKPENFEKTAREAMDMGFIGVDLNMGCPVKNVVKQGLCSGLIQNRDLADKLIRATQKGAGKPNVSIKTRLGVKSYDESWVRFLLGYEPVMLTMHFRSIKDMSKVPAKWELASELVRLRNEISPDTLLVGNGDVESRQQGEELAKKHGIDGIMVGRGIFKDPYLFAKNTPWESIGAKERKQLFAKHIKLFKKEWEGQKNPALLKKFAKVYINGFDGAKDLREQLMHTDSIDELLEKLLE
ncbi:MAG: tRNA-dihydrouridine synthase [Candidatus Saccharibacteria bacterium]|nr:tRNA-dihydrouridine synthase [Candidatus Saccharibacteria bacterium]